MKSQEIRKSYLPLSFLTLFTSMGTLLCCALPALLVSLGLGATMAGLLTAFPGLIWLSENKNALFIGSALLLIVSGFVLYRSRHWPCPTDPVQRRACLRGRKVSVVFFLSALVIYSIGFFFSFLAVPLMSIFE